MYGAGDDGGGVRQPPKENPKCELNTFVMRYTGSSCTKGDIPYDTIPSQGGFISKVSLPTIAAKDGSSEIPEFFGAVEEQEKMAEHSAAQAALDHYADWIAANPPKPKEPGENKKNKQKKKQNKRKADELGEEWNDRPPENKMRPEGFNLKFVDAPEREEREEAASRKSLNNQPAWMTRGIGVNKEIFGESQGNLVKPGMYEEDLARIEARSSNPLEGEPDPFGEIFAERKGAKEPDPMAEIFAERSGAGASSRPRPTPRPPSTLPPGWGPSRALPSKDAHFSGSKPTPSSKEDLDARPSSQEPELDPWSLMP